MLALASISKKLSSGKKNPNGFFWLIIVLLLIVLGVSVMFFSRGQNYDMSVLIITSDGEGEPSSREPRIYSISYKSGTFSPTNIRIHTGDTVRFENNGVFSIQVKSDELPGFDSLGPIPAGGIFTYTFSTKGIFNYYNAKHESEVGSVIVR